ncbi:MAG: hypothetical protein V9F00_13290 [Nocardioides sp.]
MTDDPGAAPGDPTPAAPPPGPVFADPASSPAPDLMAEAQGAAEPTPPPMAQTPDADKDPFVEEPPIWAQTSASAPWPGPGPQAGAAPRSARVPGWIWPLVAVTSLILGTLGGALGTYVTSRVLGAETTVTRADPLTPVPAPLEADNASIAAVAEKLLPSTVQVRAEFGEDGEGSTGSGFVLDRQGARCHQQPRGRRSGHRRHLDGDRLPRVASYSARHRGQEPGLRHRGACRCGAPCSRLRRWAHRETSASATEWSQSGPRSASTPPSPPASSAPWIDR